MSRLLSLRPRRTVFGALLAAVVLCLPTLAAPPRTLGATLPRLSYFSDARYTLDTAALRVHVTATVTVTGEGEDSGASRSFWEGAVITIPPSTTRFAATVAGKPLSLVVQGASSSSVSLAVGFGKRIYANQPFTFQLQFDIVDGQTATDRDLRLTHTLSSFPVFVIASPDSSSSSVTVIFPAGYSVTEEEGPLISSVDGQGRTIFEGSGLGEGDLFAWFTAETKPQPVYNEFKVGGLNVTLLYWADDKPWATAVRDIVSRGYVAMRNAIGLGDIPQGSLEIDEVSLRETGGYNGDVDISNGKIRVSYYADPFVILHELAHLWFNADMSSERWIDEGFASYYAEQAVDKLGLADRSPQLTDRKIAARIPLNDWASLADAGSIQEQYAYAASLHVARLIADIATADGLRQVWGRIKDGPATYQPIGSTLVETATNAPDWHGFLDYLEETTGKSYESIWRDWIVEPAESALMAQRLAIQAAYAKAAAAAGEWVLPPEVRESMRTWEFDMGWRDLANVYQVLSARSLIPARAVQEGTTDPRTLRAAFESGLSMGVAEAEGQIEALDSIAAAHAAETAQQGSAAGPDAFGRDPARQLVAAREAFAAGDWRQAMALADQARGAWDGATLSGRNGAYGLLGIASSILLFGALAIVLPLRYRARRRAARAGGAAAEVVASDGGSMSVVGAVPAAAAATGRAAASVAAAAVAAVAPAGGAALVSSGSGEEVGLAATIGNGPNGPNGRGNGNGNGHVRIDDGTVLASLSTPEFGADGSGQDGDGPVNGSAGGHGNGSGRGNETDLASAADLARAASLARAADLGNDVYGSGHDDVAMFRSAGDIASFRRSGDALPAREDNEAFGALSPARRPERVRARTRPRPSGGEDARH